MNLLGCNCGSLNSLFKSLLFVTLALSQYSFATADDDVSSYLLPPRLPKLPAPDSSQTLVVINENEELFRELLLASTSNWLTTSKFRMNVYSRLNYQIESPLADESLDPSPVIDHAEQIEGALLSSSREPNTFPFGSASVVNSVPDVKLRARKILWNAQFATRASSDVAYDMQLFWFSGNQPPREAGGSLKKSYATSPKLKLAEISPMPEQPWQEDELFFSESFRLTSPPAVFGYQNVTFRSLKQTRDMLWLYSPALGKTRESLEAIRGDGFLEGIMSLDDFFVFSGKPQRFDARVVADKMLFLPFVSLNEIPRSEQAIFAEPAKAVEVKEGEAVEPAADTPVSPQVASQAKEIVEAFFGEYQTFDGTRTMVHWNFQGRVATEYPLWLPISTVFVPRRVWILELRPTDPFYRFGRIVLAVDQQTYLPHFAMLYDKRGNYQKTVMGIWGHGRLASGKQVPFLGGLLVVDRTLQRAAIQTTSFVNFGGENTPIFSEGIWDEVLSKRKGAAAEEKPAE